MSGLELLTPRAALRQKQLNPSLLLSPNDDRREKENMRQNINGDSPLPSTPLKSIQDSESIVKRLSLDQSRRNEPGTPKGGRLDPDKLQDLYAACIKLANENKITQKNAWSMKLFDHIRGLTEQEQTDFVTAGCTLDAAGKIYGCRVDSVHTDIFRVIAGLSRTKTQEENEDAVTEEEDGDREEKEVGKGRGKKGAREGGSVTVEPNPQDLLLKKIETDNRADPVFSRLSQAFDEGGARGMLLNALPSDPHGRLVIDSRAPQPHSALGGTDFVLLPSHRALLDTAPLAALLHRTLHPTAPSTPTPDALLASLHALQLCPEAAAFLALDDVDPLPVLLPLIAEAQGQPERAGEEGEGEGGVAEEEGEGAAESESDDAGAAALELELEREVGEELAPEGGGGLSVRGGGGEQGAGRRVAGLEDLDLWLPPHPHADDYSYFSLQQLRTWAGPSHWTLRHRGQRAAGAVEGGEEKAKEAKAAFVLELRGAAPSEMRKRLKASRASTVLASVSLDSHRLPRDHRYLPLQLNRLFLRPRTRVAATSSRESFLQEVQSWDGGDDEEEGWGAGGGAEEEEGGGGEEHVGGLALLEKPRLAQKLCIQYARTATRVDVKGLKAQLWTSLREPAALPPADSQVAEAGAGGEAVGGHAFSAVLSSISAEEFPEVSVSLAFICLLHLANDHSLALVGSEQERTAAGGSLCKGALDELLIAHDP